MVNSDWLKAKGICAESGTKDSLKTPQNNILAVV